MPALAPLSPRKMFPPPTTTPIWTPRLWTWASSMAVARSTFGSSPNPPSLPQSASAESFRTMRRYRRAGCGEGAPASSASGRWLSVDTLGCMLEPTPMRKGTVILLVMLSHCGSCNDKAIDDSSTDGQTPIAQLTGEQKAQVLAKVGDRTITLGDYVAALEHMDQFDRMRYSSPERRKELLDEMIEVELLAREAESKGYDKDPMAAMEMRAILRESLLKKARKGSPAPADITDDEVRAYFDSHKDDYKDPERRRIA